MEFSDKMEISDKMELSSDPIQTGTKREPSKTKEESGGPALAGGRRRTRLGGTRKILRNSVECISI